MRTPVPFSLPVAAVCAVVLLPLPSAPAWADPRDGVALEAGYGQHTDVDRVALTREWSRRWEGGPGWGFTGYWDASIARWRPHNPIGGNQNVTDIGFTPVWRLVQQQTGAFAPFAEVAVGAHYISNHEPWTRHQMSTHFQFGDHVGVGASLGDQRAVDVALRFQHLSNGGLENPNPGINFFELRADYHF